LGLINFIYNFLLKGITDETFTVIDEEDETIKDPEEHILQNDLHTQVLLEVNGNIEDENEYGSDQRNHEDLRKEFIIEENLGADRDHIMDE
jgi:hypothetical protein